MSAVLTGLAVGDALGMPFEMRKATDRRLLDWNGGYGSSKYHKLGPGQFTDDTQMSLALAESIIARRGFDPKDAMTRYLHWFQTGARGAGKTIKAAMQRYFEDPTVPSGIVGSLGNGTVMRCAPIGVAYRHSPLLASTIARLDARLTHDSDEAAAASGCIAGMIAWLLRGREILTARNLALEFCGSDAMREAVTLATTDPWDSRISPGAIQTAAIAMVAVVKTRSYIEAVESVIRLGGDTDTNAAVTGALAAAHYGRYGIPSDLREGLEDARRIDDLDAELASCVVSPQFNDF